MIVNIMYMEEEHDNMGKCHLFLMRTEKLKNNSINGPLCNTRVYSLHRMSLSVDLRCKIVSKN